MMQCFPDQLTGYSGRRVTYFDFPRAMVAGRGEIVAQFDTLNIQAAMGIIKMPARLLKRL